MIRYKYEQVNLYKEYINNAEIHIEHIIRYIRLTLWAFALLTIYDGDSGEGKNCNKVPHLRFI